MKSCLSLPPFCKVLKRINLSCKVLQSWELLGTKKDEPSTMAGFLFFTLYIHYKGAIITVYQVYSFAYQRVRSFRHLTTKECGRG
jgi:hypothetical protein